MFYGYVRKQYNSYKYFKTGSLQKTIATQFKCFFCNNYFFIYTLKFLSTQQSNFGYLKLEFYNDLVKKEETTDQSLVVQ